MRALLLGLALLTIVGCGASASESGPAALSESAKRGTTDAQGIQTLPSGEGGGTKVVRDDGQK